MAGKTRIADELKRYYRGADVPMRVIRRFARDVVEQFQPDKIILFGSHAYGTPHEESDVDILVVMPCRNQIDQALKIHNAIDPPFELQLLVRTPRNFSWRLADKESFHTEIAEKGLVLYEKSDPRMDPKSRDRFSGRQAHGSRKRPSE